MGVKRTLRYGVAWLAALVAVYALLVAFACSTSGNPFILAAEALGILAGVIGAFFLIALVMAVIASLFAWARKTPTK